MLLEYARERLDIWDTGVAGGVEMAVDLELAVEAVDGVDRMEVRLPL